jgi:hypothetical protein
MSGKKQARNGKPASTPSGKRSGGKAALQRSELQRLLACIYNTYQKLDDPAANKTCRRDFVFHMTDWEDNLRALAELYEHPEQFCRADAGRIVAGFLYHATAHVMEATRLLLDYEPGYLFDSPKSKRAAAPVKPAQK